MKVLRVLWWYMLIITSMLYHQAIAFLYTNLTSNCCRELYLPAVLRLWMQIFDNNCGSGYNLNHTTSGWSIKHSIHVMGKCIMHIWTVPSGFHSYVQSKYGAPMRTIRDRGEQPPSHPFDSLSGRSIDRRTGALPCNVQRQRPTFN
jgi:hypothetical protein